MTFVLSDLPYAYDDLEPHIDTRTMEVHHTKHHQGYTNKLNDSLHNTEYADWSIEKLFSHLGSLPDSIRVSVGNNGGGYYNHNLFRKSMTPGGCEMSSRLEKLIVQSFGSVNECKKQFTHAALTQFGSGWAWLYQKEDGSLHVCNTANQYNPLMQGYVDQGIPLLCLDVREHAYYLHYQNRRAEYIDAWWNIVNRDSVEEKLV